VKKMAVSLVLLGIVAAGISAQKTREGFFLDQSLQASYNPLGVQLVTKAYYRLPLVKADGVLWESTKIDLGVQNGLSPAYDMLGVYIDIAPIAIFDLALSAQAVGYYNGLGFGFYDLSGYSSGFDSSSLGALPSRNAMGYVLSAAPTLKFAYGPIVMANTFSLTYFYTDDGSGFFFERIANCVLAKSDVELANQAYLLATIMPGLLAGVNDTLLYVPGSGYLSHRLTALGIYSTRLSEKVSVNGVLMMGTYFADRYYQYAFYIAAQAGVSLAL
jgi:hypothetical protein